jgi:hypothetical protein
MMSVRQDRGRGHGTAPPGQVTRTAAGAGAQVAGALPPEALLAEALLAEALLAEALFKEARQRRRRRRLAGAMVSLVLAGSVAAGVIIGGRHHDPPARTRESGQPVAPAKASPARITLPAVRMAWIDSAGDLVVGDLATGARHVAGPSDSSDSWPPVSTDGHVYWSDFNKTSAPIRDYDLATGKVRYLARGESAFASADGRHLYIEQSDRALIELHGDGSGPPAVLRVPAGWYAAAGNAPWLALEGAVAGGIVVYSSDNQDPLPGSEREGIWNPRTGQVRILGQGREIIDAYTPPGARYSLIAWIPASGRGPNTPEIEVTNTSTLATVTVHSPLHHGFAFSGIPAFSPGGTRIALFARTATLGTGGMSKLVIASTRTGAVRLVPGVSLFTTEDAFWAMWLPGGQRLLAGALTSGYVVDTRTLAARPFAFFPSVDGFSAVVIPGR